MIIDQSSIVGQKFIPISWMISDLAESCCCCCSARLRLAARVFSSPATAAAPAPLLALVRLGGVAGGVTSGGL